MRYVLLVLRLLVGGVFLLASLDKIAHPEVFVVSVHKYHLLPGALVPLTAVTLPWVELVAGLALVVGLGIEGAALVASGLLVAFLAGMGINLARGVELDCGCFGFLIPNEKVGPVSLTRDALLLLAALTVAFWGRQGWGAEWLGRRRRKPPTQKPVPPT